MITLHNTGPCEKEYSHATFVTDVGGGVSMSVYSYSVSVNVVLNQEQLRVLRDALNERLGNAPCTKSQVIEGCSF
jgi:hypothetical protein